MRNLILLILLVALSSCSGYYYTASPHYVPNNSEKGDLKANISANFAQAGYAFSNHFSLFSTGYYRFRASTFDWGTFSTKENGGGNSYTDKAYEVNFGGSYFYKKGILHYEVLFGAGFGNLKFDHRIDVYTYDYEFNMNCQKYNLFIQPNIEFRFNKKLDLNLSTKFSQQNFYDIKTNVVWGDYNGEYICDDYFFDKTRASLYYIEPALTFRAGLEKLKIQVQMVPVFSLNDTYIRYREFGINLSLFLNLNTFGNYGN